MDNAVKEHDEHDQEDGGTLDLKEVYLTPTTSLLAARSSDLVRVSYCIFAASKAPHVLKEVDGPPPRS
jgi:hypothetical protein